MNRTRTSRRTFLAGLAATACAGPDLAATVRRPPRVLLRSSWQTVNIGDIAHTPGMLRLLGEHLPDAEVTLWPGNIGLVQAAVALPLRNYGVAYPVGFAYGIVLQAIEIACGVGLGLLAIAREGISVAMLRRMEEDEESSETAVEGVHALIEDLDEASERDPEAARGGAAVSR